MKAKNIYLALFILGTILPYSQFILFLVENGLDRSLFWRQLWVNPISSFFGLDVILSALVLFYFIWVESKKLKIKYWWFPILATLVIGVSSGLPLFLWMRQIRIDKSTKRYRANF